MSYYYWEVKDHLGKTICHCGSEADARMMISLGGKNRRIFVRCQFLPPDTVNTTAELVEEYHLPQQKVLQPNTDEPFKP